MDNIEKEFNLEATLLVKLESFNPTGSAKDRPAKAIIEKEGLCRDIAIVTDGFHQLRADIFAKKQELRAYNLPSETEEWLLPTYWIREWFGIIHCLVFD